MAVLYMMVFGSMPSFGARCKSLTAYKFSAKISAPWKMDKTARCYADLESRNCVGHHDNHKASEQLRNLIINDKEQS